jgi:hypothetical protein
MGFTDVILFPLYVFIFHLIFSARRKRMNDPILRKYHKHGFWLRVFSSVAFTIFFVYLTGGDSTSLYYPEGYHISRLILNDPVNNIHLLFTSGINYDENLLLNPDNIGYLRVDSNLIVIKLVAILSFFTFGKYLLINLCFSMISYSGVWRLYKFFYENYPHLHKKIAIAIIYLPTLIFWSSGVLKDPLCTGMLGWMTYSLYCIFEKRQSIIKNMVIAFFAAYILSIVKVYILISYLPFYALYLVLSNIKGIKNTILKIAVGSILVLLGIVGLFALANKLKEELGFFALDKITESVKTQQTNFINMADQAESSFSLGVEYDGSLNSLLKMSPAAIVATFFRPFLWESKKISTLLSSLESLALMILTFYTLIKAGPVKFFGAIFTNSMIFFCFFYSVLFALFIGATTLNFGTLVRYKIPSLPFYIIAIFLILEDTVKKKNIAIEQEPKPAIL